MWIGRRAAALILAFCLNQHVAPAEAAVRVCIAGVLGDVSHAPSELEARRLAITSWKAKAARAGRAFTSWRLATRKHYRCARLKDSRYSCVAFAIPCRVSQVVPRRRKREGLPPGPPPHRPNFKKQDDGARNI